MLYIYYTNKIKNKGVKVMTLSPQELLSAKEWNKIIKTNIENAIGSKLDGDFVAANYPAGFNYAVKQQYYNADSLSTFIGNCNG